jgi:hypothetical protein
MIFEHAVGPNNTRLVLGYIPGNGMDGTRYHLDHQPQDSRVIVSESDMALEHPNKLLLYRQVLLLRLYVTGCLRFSSKEHLLVPFDEHGTCFFLDVSFDNIQAVHIIKYTCIGLISVSNLMHQASPF